MVDELRLEQRIAAIMAEMPSIDKDGKNASQNYTFASIEQIVNKLRPLMAKHGIVLLPTAIEETCDERSTRSGGTAEAWRMKVTWILTDGESDRTVVSVGQANDTGDKGANKAFTQAWKQAITKVFGVAADADNDAESPEPTSRSKPTKRQEPDRQRVASNLSSEPAPDAKHMAYESAAQLLSEYTTDKSGWAEIIANVAPELQGRPSRDYVAEDWKLVAERLTDTKATAAQKGNGSDWGEAFGEV